MSELDSHAESEPATNGHAAAPDVEMGDPATPIDVKQEAVAYPSDPNFSTSDANAAAHTSNSTSVFSSLENAQPRAGSATPHSSSAMARNAATTPSATRQSTPGAVTGPSTSLNALPPSAIIPPANPHGSSTRVYLNSKVTPVLLEGMKWVAMNEPEKPLKWLGEFLLQKSAEVEGS